MADEEKPIESSTVDVFTLCPTVAPDETVISANAALNEALWPDLTLKDVDILSSVNAAVVLCVRTALELIAILSSVADAVALCLTVALVLDVMLSSVTARVAVFPLLDVLLFSSVVSIGYSAAKSKRKPIEPTDATVPCATRMPSFSFRVNVWLSIVLTGNRLKYCVICALTFVSSVNI